MSIKVTVEDVGIDVEISPHDYWEGTLDMSLDNFQRLLDEKSHIKIHGEWVRVDRIYGYRDVTPDPNRALSKLLKENE